MTTTGPYAPPPQAERWVAFAGRAADLDESARLPRENPDAQHAGVA